MKRWIHANTSYDKLKYVKDGQECYLPTWYLERSDEEIEKAKQILIDAPEGRYTQFEEIDIPDEPKLRRELRKEGFTGAEIEEILDRVANGSTLDSAIQRQHQRKVTSATELLPEEISEIDVDSLVPDAKDEDRALGLKFKQGKTFRGNGQPWGSEAAKMAKLIKDPYKLVRRAKAVVDRYGSYEGRYSNVGWYHFEEPDPDTDVWGPFKRRLEEMGFTSDQISKIANYSSRGAK